jgi:hypothetical protein
LYGIGGIYGSTKSGANPFLLLKEAGQMLPPNPSEIRSLVSHVLPNRSVTGNAYDGAPPQTSKASAAPATPATLAAAEVDRSVPCPDPKASTVTPLERSSDPDDMAQPLPVPARILCDSWLQGKRGACALPR